jgi:hypothetical protein
MKLKRITYNLIFTFPRFSLFVFLIALNYFNIHLLFLYCLFFCTMQLQHEWNCLSLSLWIEKKIFKPPARNQAHAITEYCYLFFLPIFIFFICCMLLARVLCATLLVIVLLFLFSVVVVVLMPFFFFCFIITQQLCVISFHFFRELTCIGLVDMKNCILRIASLKSACNFPCVGERFLLALNLHHNHSTHITYVWVSVCST